MAEDESVKVAVRMRIFNQREINNGCQRIVRMTKEDVGSKTYIKNPDTGDEKCFPFDFSFQSHTKDDPEAGPYADQNTVFNDLGKPVLDMALEGRNICLFAYGQTGAGKSFSMLGKTNPPEMQGIIPRSCVEIFRLRDMEKDDPCVTYKIEMQVVEIYCEMINDLLANRKTWPPNGHKPKMTKDGYVVDTVLKPCFNYDDIEAAFTFADKNRSVGSHALNPESSRAHTIYTINYMRQKKATPDAKLAETVTSKINLVDLAGSERSESAGTTGQMLKEGNAINLSLTALGSTIKALSEGKRPNFRDSKLTLLLQGSMTNGKVIMIAAVSPASINYDESLSTLRFAERIKMVKIKAKKNVTQDPVAEIKKEMEEMRQRMQEEIDSLRNVVGGGDPEQMQKQEEELASLLEARKEAEAELKRDMEQKLAALSESDSDRKKKAAAINSQWSSALGGASTKKVEAIEEPHLRNLNEEARLAETLAYSFNPGETIIGRADKANPPTIEFNGMGVIKHHCTVEFNADEKKVFITSNNPSSTLINGHPCKEKTELKHNNRLWIGNNYAFRFVFPGQEDAGEKMDPPPDYLFAEAEIAEIQGQASSSTSGLPTALGHQLSDALKKVEQANIIVKDLNVAIEFRPKLVKDRDSGKDVVAVAVQLPHTQLVWPWEKFSARLVDMVRLWQQFQYSLDTEDATFTLPPPENSPFVDFEEQLIGEADVWLHSLGCMMESASEPQIVDLTTNICGKLHVRVCPQDEKGGEGPWEGDTADLDPFVEKASDLSGQTIKYSVKVDKIDFDPSMSKDGACKYNKVFVRYKVNFHDRSEGWSATPSTSEAASMNPSFTYSQNHANLVDDAFLRHLTNETTGKIRFQVWGVLVESAGAATTKADVGAKQEELLKTLAGLVKDCPSAEALPDGWMVVPLFKGPDGKLERKIPTA